MRQTLLALMSELSAKDEQLRDKAVELERVQREAAFKQTLIDKLTHEMAVLKRLKFAATSERFRAGLSAEQTSLLEETLDGDIAEVTSEIERATGDNKGSMSGGMSASKFSLNCQIVVPAPMNWCANRPRP